MLTHGFRHSMFSYRNLGVLVRHLIGCTVDGCQKLAVTLTAYTDVLGRGVSKHPSQVAVRHTL